MPPITIPTFGYIALTEAVNNITAVPSFIRSMLFPREITHPTRTVMIDIISGGKKIAPFVKRGNPSKLMSNTGLKTQTVEPPSIRLKKFLTPTDLSLRQAGDQIFVVGGGGGNPLEAARKAKIAIEQKDQKDTIDRTIEFMCAKALMGAYTVVQDDLEFSIDFGMPSANKPVLEGGALWSAKSTCTPLKNLREWRNLAMIASGKIPTLVLYNSTTAEYVLAADEVIKYANLLKINLGNIQTENNVIEMSALKVAQFDGMTHYAYNGTYTDADGNEQKLIPDGKVILASPTADNRIHYAAIEEIALVIGKYFSKDVPKDDPSGLELIVESDPLPACHQPDANIYATVA